MFPIYWQIYASSCYLCRLFGNWNYLGHAELESAPFLLWLLCKLLSLPHFSSWLYCYRATIISIIRVVANATADLSDVTYGFVPAAIYSTVEANTGIICASVSCLAPLVRLCIRRNPRSSEADSTKNSGSFADDEMTFRSRSMKSRAMPDNGYGMLPVDGGSPTPTLSSDKTGSDSIDVAVPGRIIVRSDIYVEREAVWVQKVILG